MVHSEQNGSGFRSAFLVVSRWSPINALIPECSGSGAEKLSPGSTHPICGNLFPFPAGRSMRLARLLTFVAVVGLLGSLVLSVPAHAQMKVPPQSFEDVLEKARAQDTPILVEIYAPWCPHCDRMQKKVYSDETVREYLDETFIHVRLNSDASAGTHQLADRTLSTKELAAALGAKGVPTTSFLKADGTPIARQPGFIERPTFLKIIRYVGSGAYEDESFQEFTSQRSE